MAEYEERSATAAQLMGLLTGETIAAHQALVDRTQEGVSDLTRLAGIIAQGTSEQLASAVREIFHEDPKLAESPAVKRIEASARPQHKHAPLLEACLEADVPAYLYGEAGSGKSTAAVNAADIRGVNLRAASLSPGTSKSDLVGYMDANGTYHPSGFREVYEDGGVFLFDEIDNGNPSVTALMNRALAGWENEFPDKSVQRNWNTRIMAAANTIGKGATAQYVGRNPIDAATLDRFAMIPWDIDERLEDLLMKVDRGPKPKAIPLDTGGIPTNVEWLNQVRGFRRRASEKGLRVVISPRSAIYGRKLAEQGVGVKWLTEMLIYKGMSATDREKLSRNFF